MHRFSSVIYGIFAAVILVVATQNADAQATSTGEIHGVVRDPSAALVPNVTLRLTDTATSIEKSATSTSDGAFIFLSLQAGTYRLTASAQGFQTAIYDQVVVQTARTTDIVVQMKVGAVTETVEVAGAAAQLETSSSEIAATVSSNYIQNLPFSGRDTLTFALLMAGSQTANDPSGRTSTFNGMPNASMNISIDGVNNNSQRFKTGGTSFFEFAPSRLDAVDQITVATAGAGAESSGEGAMQIQFTTRRGTEIYHGKVFEQFQNEDLNANTFFKNLQGQPISKIRNNNFGGSFGGRLAPFVPYFRNKLFFFLNLEAFPQPGSTTLAANVLTSGSQQGNFTYIGTDGQQRTVNLLQVAAQNNLASSIDPVTAKILSQINGTLSKASGFVPISGKPYAQTMQWTQTTSTKTLYPTARLDYQITPRIAWHGTWNLRYQNIQGSAPDYPGAGAYNNAYKITTYVATNSVDYTITPHILNGFTFGVQSNGEFFSQGADPHQWADYGNRVINLPTFNLPASVPGNSVSNSAPPGGITPFVNSATPFIRNNPVYNLSDNVNWLKGRHKFTIGGTLLHTSFYETSYGTAGVPNYNLGLATGDPAATILQNALPNISTTNGDLANAQALYALLTGRLSSVSIRTNVNETTHQYAQFAPVTQRFAFTTGALYFQDSFRWNPQFTLNYGLRWEFDGVIHNTNGIDTEPGPGSFFGPSTGPFQPGALNGVANPVFQLTSSPYGRDFKNPSPNVGFAWNPSGGPSLPGRLLGDHKTVIRASYSISHYNEGMNVISNLLPGNPGASQSGALNPGAPGFPIGGLNVSSAIPSFAVNPPSFTTTLPQSAFTFNSSANFINPNLRSPYLQSWTFGIQRELAHGTVLETRYLGNKATRMWHQYDYQETNIFENGFLQQFIQAQANLSINAQNGKPNTFAFNSFPGQAPTPIFDAAFGARGTCSNCGAVANGSGYGSGGFITNLQQGVAGTLAGSLAGNSTYLCRMVGSNFAPCASLGFNAPGPFPINFFRPNPFVNTLQYIDDNGNTNYNALQVELRKAYSHGLTLVANYTWSHTLGNIYNTSSQSGQTQDRTLRNNHLDYGPTPFDIRQAFQTYWTYDLPFGKGRRFSLSNPIAERALGGWTIGALYRFTSGYVQQMNGTRNTVNGFTTGTSAGVVLNGLTIGQLQHDLNTIGGYNASGKNLITNSAIIGANGQANPQFILPASTPGVFNDFLYLHGPNYLQMDMSLTKEIPIKERFKFAFQLEALNFLNHPVFAMGNTTPTSASFGQVSSTLNNPRNVQLRAYLTF
ncbi:MAG TPA: TonB-dependent receptor [Bryobacteraceae bacterium]|nr:TonB-dependent receptor [Bryobacteraceae bacterium]